MSLTMSLIMTVIPNYGSNLDSGEPMVWQYLLEVTQIVSPSSIPTSFTIFSPNLDSKYHPAITLIANHNANPTITETSAILTEFQPYLHLRLYFSGSTISGAMLRASEAMPVCLNTSPDAP